jgi:hypothetical protein
VKLIKKKCTKCGEEFEETTEFFYRNKNTKDGLTHWCKSCMLQYSKSYASSNHDKVLDYKRQWRANNTQINRDVVRQWRIDNLKHKDEYCKQYRKTEIGKEKCKQYNQTHRKHDITKDEWKLYKEYFDYQCAYCGITEKDAKQIYKQYLQRNT